MAGEEAFKYYVCQNKYVILAVIASTLAIIGIILMVIPSTKIMRMENVVDYTKCHAFISVDDDEQQECREYLKNSMETTCDCIMYHTLEMPLEGVVTLYYELPTFDQTKYVQSRDDDQLKGIISSTPSANCEPYRYDDGNRTIVPCGALANFMFKDRVGELILNFTNIILVRGGILTAQDKTGFHNPANIKEALQNYSKPKNWDKPIYELDLTNADNNGFQNEDFISWMKTDMKRKPIGRVDHSNVALKEGLPAGKYQINIAYTYAPPDIFDGQRRLIFVAEKEIVNTDPFTAGIVVLTVGLLLFAAGGLLYIKKYLEDKKTRDDKEQEQVRQNVDNTTNAPKPREEQNALPLLPN